MRARCEVSKVEQQAELLHAYARHDWYGQLHSKNKITRNGLVLCSPQSKDAAAASLHPCLFIRRTVSPFQARYG